MTSAPVRGRCSAPVRSRLARALLLAGLAAPLLLTGCGSGAGDEPAATSAPDSPAGDAAAPEDDTCAQLIEAGADGSVFGPVQALLPRDDTIERIDLVLVPLETVEPAAEVAQEWATLQSYLEEYRAAAEALPPDGVVSAPELFNPGGEVAAAQDAMTDWWFATCD